MIRSIMPWIARHPRECIPMGRVGQRMLSDDIQKTHWSPEKRVSRQTMEKIRMLAAKYPDEYDTKALSSEFKLSYEAVQRILKSKFRPTLEIAKRQEANRYAAMGLRKKAKKKHDK